MRSADELWERNLPRYFALYLTPQDGNNEIRFSLTRIAGRFAEEVYLAAAQVAREQGSSTIERIHVGWALHQWLPSEMNSYREVVFFPGAEESLRLAVEIYDLEVFRNTGFGWELLEKLAASEVVSRDTSLTIRPDAARMLAEGINTYSLLVLRLAGRQAAETLSPRLFSRHLQLGVRSLAELLKANNDSAAVRADRPIGGESEAFPSTFLRDVSKSAGVDFRHTSSEWLSLFRRYEGTFPTFGGGGVGAGDLDGDGWPDLVFCGGNGCTAYRNRGDTSFHEVGEDWGLRVPGEARMAVLADFDNDGQRDIFMTYVRDPNRLFRNLGGGRFADLSGSSGLAREGDISGPAIAFDYNGDGLLDIYLGNFGNYLEFQSPWILLDAQNAMPNRLYRNLGNFKFEEVAETAGVGNTGWTQAISHVDTDGDGDQDIYVANDFGRNDLLINNGDGTFQSAGEATGTDDPFHGMNVAFSDLNQDRLPDIFVTNIWDMDPLQVGMSETNSLFISELKNSVLGYHRSLDPHLTKHDTGWSWAALFLDADNDGDDDLFVATGFTDYLTSLRFRAHPTMPGKMVPYNNAREQNVLLLNEDGLPVERVEPCGAELGEVNSRSLALLDYDLDGDLDLAVTTFHSQAHLFRNDGAPKGNHWLSVELVGEPSRQSNRDAIGAQLMVRDGERLYVWRAVTGGEGYLGTNTPAAEFGLGESTGVDVEIVWPGGQRQLIEGVPADYRIRVYQSRTDSGADVR